MFKKLENQYCKIGKSREKEKSAAKDAWRHRRAQKQGIGNPCSSIIAQNQYKIKEETKKCQ